MIKVIRIWRGEEAVGVLMIDPVSRSATYATGPGNSAGAIIDIELDPWAGVILDHATHKPAVSFS